MRTIAATELASSVDGLDIHLHEVPSGALSEGQYTEKFVQIFESDGRVRLASASLRDQPALVPIDLVRAALRGQAPLASVAVGRRHGRVTVLAAPVGSRSYAILVGLYRDEVDAHLARLAWLLGTVWVCGVLATSALGYGLASRALGPVVRITRRAERIAAGDFAARLDPLSSQDEVGEMSRSLNSVLERLHGALEAHRRFASDASHELRAPIAAMTGAIDVTLKRPRSAGEYRDALVAVGERLSTLTALCDDLTTLVQAQEGAQGLELTEVSVLTQLEEAAERLASVAAAGGVTIRTDQLPDLVAYAELRLLGRVFDNVLSNAVHYNHEGGQVVLCGSAEERAGDDWKPGMVAITITDTGCGIPAEQSERVFDRFFRLDPSRARLTGGSGLGLAICREVLTVLGGAIRVQSSSSSGTTIEIRVPGRLGSDRTSSKVLGVPGVGAGSDPPGPERGQTPAPPTRSLPPADDNTCARASAASTDDSMLSSPI